MTDMLQITFDAETAADARREAKNAKRRAARAAAKAAAATESTETESTALVVSDAAPVLTGEIVGDDFEMRGEEFCDDDDATDNSDDALAMLRESFNVNASRRYDFEKATGATSAQTKTLARFDLNHKTRETAKDDSFFACAAFCGVTNFDFVNRSRGSDVNARRFDLNAVSKINRAISAIIGNDLSRLEKPCRSVLRNMARCESLGVSVTREHIAALFDATKERRAERGAPLGAYAHNECAYTAGTINAQRGSTMSALLILGAVSENRVSGVLSLNDDSPLAQMARASV